MQSQEQAPVGHGVDIGHPHLRAEREWCQDSRRDLPEDLRRSPLVRHYSEYRNRCSATHNGCGSVGYAVSARSDSGMLPIVPSDFPVRPREIRSARAEHSTRSGLEKLLVVLS